MGPVQRPGRLGMGSLLPSRVSPGVVALGSLGSSQRDVLILATSCGVWLSHSGDTLSHRCGPPPRPACGLPKGRVQTVRPSPASPCLQTACSESRVLARQRKGLCRQTSWSDAPSARSELCAPEHCAYLLRASIPHLENGLRRQGCVVCFY